MHRNGLVVLRVLEAVALAGACLCGQSLMAQNSVVVGNCTNSPKSYTTIQEAVNNAASGSTVLICPGAYPEQLEISEPLTLTGMQSDNIDAVVITPPADGVLTNATITIPKPPSVQPVTGPAAAQIWIHGTTRVTVSNLTVDGNGNGISSENNNCNPLIGIYLQNASGTVQDVLTRNQETGGCSSGFGALVESDSNLSSNVTVRDSSFRSWDGFGFWAEGSGTNVTFRSNAIEGPGLSAGVNDVTYERATGTIDGNSLINALTKGPTAGSLITASCGVALVQAGPSHVTVSRNVIGNTQCGVGIYDSDGTTISSNTIFGTQVNDGVYVCGNGNALKGNTISDSDNAGIHVSCTEVSSLFPGATANNNKISNNTVNGAVVGVLFQLGAAGNRLENNEFFNVSRIVVQPVGLF
jgi:parallel beta-helix repeat protein